MANRTKVYKTSDWKVWTSTPAPGAFVLDVSQLNGSDVLRSSLSTAYRMLDVEISSISIQEGTTMEWLDPSIGFPTASVSFLYEEYDLQILKELFLGKRIAITLANAQTTADVDWGFNTPIFLGLIDNVAIDIVPGQNLVNVSLNASTYNAQYLNFQYPLPKSIGANKASLLESYLSSPSFRLYLDGDYLFGKTETVEETVGSYLMDFIQTNTMPPSYGFELTYGSSGAFTNYTYTNFLGIPADGISTKTYGQTYDSSMMFDIELGWNGLNAPSSIELTKSTNTSIVYKYADDTATNQTFFSASLDVYDLAELTSIGQKMISFQKEFVPIKISTITARNNQEYLFDSHVSGVYIFPKFLDFTGNIITLELPEYSYTSKEMIITGRTIEVTPDTFTTTYDLWKGFN